MTENTILYTWGLRETGEMGHKRKISEIIVATKNYSAQKASMIWHEIVYSFFPDSKNF